MKRKHTNTQLRKMQVKDALEKKKGNLNDMTDKKKSAENENTS
jgi:hypothetical protein